MSTTLVTGGAGFIGSNFVEHLFEASPYERIIVLDVFSYAANINSIPEPIRQSSRFELHRGNIRDERLVGQLVAQADRVVHFAAESHVSRSLDLTDDAVFFETDVLGTQCIANALAGRKHHLEKFIHISTSEVYGSYAYGKSSTLVGMDEHHPLNPCTPYAAAKAGADRLVHAYRETHGIPAIIIRPFNNYGPKQHMEKAVPRFITQALHGGPMTVHGNGLMTRDWIHVQDCCAGVMAALDKGQPGDVFNLGTERDTSVLDVARKIARIVGKKTSVMPEIIHGEKRPGQVDRHISDSGNALVKLGWRPNVNLEDGLQATVNWYDKNRWWWEPQTGEHEVQIAAGVF